MKNYYFIPLLFLCAMSQAQIVTIPDANFKNALVNTLCVDTDGDGSVDSDADTNDDGEIQESEAETVLWLSVFNQNISSLEGIQSFTNLEYLACFDNTMKSLDTSQNQNLKNLLCFSNQLTSLSMAPSIELLYCYNNLFSSLDLTQYTNLFALDCSTNQLANLDLSQNINLQGVDCGDNLLGSLDITQNSLLVEFACYANELTSLNIKNGNNHNMVTMLAVNNPNLTCIQVDNENATYPVCDIATLSGWCKDNWVQYSEDCSLGSEDFNQLSFTLYPNPTQDVLNIESQEAIDWVRIYSINGSLIKETSNPSISVSELPMGLYFAQINTGAHSITKKFIKS